MTVPAPDGLFPLTQDTAQAVFDWVYAPWIKEMGLTDFVVREGFVSMRLPRNDQLKFFAGAICGQALMAAEVKRFGKASAYVAHSVLEFAF